MMASSLDNATYVLCLPQLGMLFDACASQVHGNESSGSHCFQLENDGSSNNAGCALFALNHR